MMANGIIIFGSPGSGTTTLGKEIASQLCYKHLDLDDFIWRWDTKIPFSELTPQKERIDNIMSNISKHLHFVMSGSMWSIRKTFEPLFELGVYVVAPAIIRAERLRKREIRRWGNRVLPGGDIYEFDEIHKDYFATARQYDIDESSQSYRKQHEQWATELPCPVLHVDGTKEIFYNAEAIIMQYKCAKRSID